MHSHGTHTHKQEAPGISVKIVTMNVPFSAPVAFIEVSGLAFAANHIAFVCVGCPGSYMCLMLLQNTPESGFYKTISPERKIRTLIILFFNTN